MFTDHPLVGVGPGCYGWQYFTYKLRVAQDHPGLVTSPSYPLNFGEAHNDHLQMLAVGGLPAYLLFLGSLGWISTASFRRARAAPEITDACSEFAKTFALPFSVALTVLAFGSFPLEIAATTLSNLFLAALVVRWNE
jgi:O-antigen ligase